MSKIACFRCGREGCYICNRFKFFINSTCTTLAMKKNKVMDNILKNKSIWV